MTRRDDIRSLYEQGASAAAIARELGITPSTVSFHLRKLGVPVDARFARRYDWKAVQAFYDTGHTVRQCQAEFGFSTETWHAAKLRGDIVTRATSMPVDQLLAGRRSRNHLKGRLLREGLLEDRCAACGLVDWCGAPLSLALHHVNGDPHDNRLENLQLLCPNCHSQTENFAGRNKRARRAG